MWHHQVGGGRPVGGINPSAYVGGPSAYVVSLLISERPAKKKTLDFLSMRHPNPSAYIRTELYKEENLHNNMMSHQHVFQKQMLVMFRNL